MKKMKTVIGKRRMELDGVIAVGPIDPREEKRRAENDEREKRTTCPLY